jgi:hypothetical protein
MCFTNINYNQTLHERASLPHRIKGLETENQK